MIGRLDTTTAPILDEMLQGIDENIGHLTFDCDDLNYISSSGLRVFLQTRKRFGKDVVNLAKVHPYVYEILEITGFQDFFDIEVVTDKVKEQVDE